MTAPQKETPHLASELPDPERRTGALDYLTCGLSLTLQMSHVVDSLYISNAPLEGHTNFTPSDRVSPGCPINTENEHARRPVETETKWYTTITGIPAGVISATAKTGHAGELVYRSTGGPIGSVYVNLHKKDTYSDGPTETRVVANARNVNIRKAEWDLDGDTRYNNNPQYLFIDTAGTFVESLSVWAAIQQCTGRSPLTLSATGQDPVALHNYRFGFVTHAWGKKCGSNIQLPPDTSVANFACYGTPALRPLQIRLDVPGSPIAGFLARTIYSFDEYQPYPTPAPCPHPSPRPPNWPDN